MCERLLELVVDHLIFLDVEDVEDGLVQQPALLVAASTVKFARVLQQLEAGFDEPCAHREVRVGLLEPFGEVPTLALDFAELGLDLCLRDGAIGGQVDEIRLATVERAEFLLELLVEESNRRFLLRNGLRDVRPDLYSKPAGEPDRAVVDFDRIFEEDRADVWRRACAALAVTAEEVQIRGASVIDAPLDEHPRLDAGSLAATAEE